MRPDPPSSSVRIDAAFPGGNILVDSIGAGEATLRQDQRDTERWWFHWGFRICGATGRWQFRFVDGDVIGTQGPAYSLDKGQTWAWLGRDSVTQTPGGASFGYGFDGTGDEVRFAFAMPYLQSHLQAFLGDHPEIKRGILCQSRKNRDVELLHLPCRQTATCRLLLTARHHCCESVANWVLEGILEAALADTAVGGWYRQHVDLLAVPFVDKDGVEDGDQGKGRHPHDHGRDYAQDRPAVYPETGALRERIPGWAQDGPMVVLDLHCPWIRGTWNEQVYMVGSSVPGNASAQQRLARLVASVHRGDWEFRETDFLPYGESWNTAANTTDGETCCRFATRHPAIRLATTFEIPYASVRDARVSPAAARAFGHSVAAALRIFMASDG